jgi:anti-sigma B factor antagonist
MAAENTPEPADDFLVFAQSFGRIDGFEPFRVTLVQHDQAIVLAYVVGEVDMLTGPSLQSHLDQALATRPERLIVDLSQVSFLGSTGLAVLINAQEAATCQGTTVQLRGIGRAAARVLQATNLASFFEIVPSKEGPGG